MDWVRCYEGSETTGMSPRSENDTASAPPTTIWSSTFTSTSEKATAIRRVMVRSCSLGSATPEGWQWAIMVAPALRARARCTKILGNTVAPLMEPKNKSSQASIRCRLSRNRQENTSRSCSADRKMGIGYFCTTPKKVHSSSVA